MAEVKWIKITTDIFDDEKILLIESLPDAYAIITVWFKLLCLAGKQNNSGVFMMGQIAYTDKMLATIFRMKESTVTMALQTFESFGMIEIVDGVITIPNWEKHQSLDKFEIAKENTRKRVARHREKQKMLAQQNGVTECNAECNVTVTVCNADRIDKEEDIEEYKEKESIKEKETRRKYGEYKNILLSDSDLEKLKAEFPLDYQDRIENLSSYIASTGKTYKNHLATIRNWARKEKTQPKAKTGSWSKSYDAEAVERMIINSTKPSKTAKDDENIRERAEALRRSFTEGGTV